MNFENILSIIQEYLKKPLVTLILGLIIGIIIGLPILGWGVFPVKWQDAAPTHLREDIKEEYVRMMIESFAYNHDSYLALSRWQELGEGANGILASVQADPNLVSDDVASFSMLVGVPYTPTFITEEGTESEAVPEQALLPSDMTDEGERDKGKISPLLILGILCPLLLIVGGVLAYILVIRKRPSSLLSSAKQDHEEDTYISDEAYYEQDDDSPLAQYMTTYMLGDDLYDDSFSIDSPTGEFLGECGVGISETIGVGDPKKVAAFEVWLFDKNDIQTVTKVLMSDHAFNDPTISQRLVSKGEPVIIEPGKVIMLETATLQLEARVVDLDYGKGALPANSFFDRLTLELAVWPK